MSKHWNPDGELARTREMRTTRGAWPAGATAGIALVAAACLGVVVTLYWVAGPRDAFASDVTVEAGD